MRHILFSAVLTVAAAPMAAQDIDEGASLMEQGARIFMEGMLQELDPALKDFADLAMNFGPELDRMVREFGPAIENLLRVIDDFDNYMPPEILPNGDIIIRRKPDAPDYVPGDEIEI